MIISNFYGIFMCLKYLSRTIFANRSILDVWQGSKYACALKHWFKAEAFSQRCSVKKVFLEISQNSQEKRLCQSPFFNKVAGQRPANLFIKRLAQVFPVNFAKFLGTSFLTEHLRWLLLSKKNHKSVPTIGAQSHIQEPAKCRYDGPFFVKVINGKFHHRCLIRF